MARRLQKESGFTLIEVMFSAVILATGVLALSGMQGISLTRNIDANELTRATNLAAEMMERIQFNRRNVTAYNAINTAGACAQDATLQPMARGDCDQWRNLLASTFATGLTGVQGQVAVTTPIGPVVLNQSQVIVTLSWTGSAGANKGVRARQVVLSGVVAPE